MLLPMIVTTAALKSGGKSVTAIHLAHFLNQDAPTCIVDTDKRNKSCIMWAQHDLLDTPVFEGGQVQGEFEHYVIDTGASLEKDDLAELAENCDFLVVPSFPTTLNLRVLIQAIDVLKGIKTPYKVLLTNVPPRPSRDGQNAKDTLMTLDVPVFKQTVRRTVWLDRAALEGVTVNKLGSAAKGAYRDYENVYTELMQSV